MSTSANEKRAIATFLTSAFLPSELRRIISLYLGDDAQNQLPSDASSLEDLAWAVVETVARHEGTIAQDFFEFLRGMRPKRAQEISSLQGENTSQEHTISTTAIVRGVLVTAQMDPNVVLSHISSHRRFTRFASDLAKELAQIFPTARDVETILEEALVIVQEHRPDAKPLSKAQVALTGAGLTAWRMALSEAANVGPIALASLLLAAQANTDNHLSATRVTLARLLEAT